MDKQPDQESAGGMRRVKAHAKRRCPHCQSPKWVWLGAVPTTIAELERCLLVRYCCKLCGQEFLVEEAKRSRVVARVERCVHCKSSALEKTSRPHADVEIWRCLRCDAYMMVAPDGAGVEQAGLVVQLPIQDATGKAADKSKVL